MTMNLPLSNSPRTQSFEAQQGADTDEMFADAITQKAYEVFSKTFPELSSEIVTLKTIDLDVDEGRATGVFILDHNQEIFYVPVTFSNNEIKPFDVFYTKRLDRFYPLSLEWLNEATKSSIGELGHPVQAPKTLSTDVDIRNLVVPPTTGRYSYASLNEEPSFLQFLTNAPNTVKEGTLRFFAKRNDLFKTAVEIYGRERLGKALRKTATIEENSSMSEQKLPHGKYKTPVTGNVLVADKNTASHKLREMFGEESGEAYSVIRTKGFYAKDYRKETGAVIESPERAVTLVEPAHDGLYRIYFHDGSAETALVLTNYVKIGYNEQNKFDLKNNNVNSKRPKEGYRDTTYPASRSAASQSPRYFIFFKDGRYSYPHTLMAEPLSSTHDDCEKFVGKGGSPQPRDKGFLISTTGLSFRATEYFHVENTREGEAGRKVISTTITKIILDPTMTGKTILWPSGQEVAYIPSNYKFIKLKDRIDSDNICMDPKGIFKNVEAKLKTAGAVPVKVTFKSDGYYVGRGGPSLSKAAALLQTAVSYNICLPHAEKLLKLAESNSVKELWAINSKVLAKLAAGAPQGAPPPDPNGGQMPPMDPSMMAPPGPQQPTSIELAAAEMLQQLQSQQDSLAQQMQLLQQVAARAQQIEASGAGVMASPLAAQMIAPPQGQQQGQQQGQPPMDPSGQPTMDPSQAGGQPGMQPGMEQPPPTARMKGDQLTAENVAQSINPQFMQDAAALDDANVFDAAAVASLAQNNDTMVLAQAYTPKMESALDALGRLLTLFNMKEDAIREQFGQESFALTVQKIRDLVKGLGDTLLKIEQMGQHRTPNYADTH